MAMKMVKSDGGGRSTSTAKKYDPSSGKWVNSVSNPTSTTNTKTVPKTNTTSTGSSSSSYTSPTPTTTKVDSQKDSDKKYIETEFNILTGDLTLTSTTKSIKIKVNDTVKLEGLGDYLSGLYFVSAVKRTITKDGGYSHVLSLIKNGFGSSVKKAVEVVVVPEQPKEEPRKEEVVKTSPEFKVGDSVRIVGDNAVYSNASNGVRVPNWVKKKTLTIRQISGDKNRVLLMPILSWTYVKFIKKV